MPGSPDLLTVLDRPVLEAAPLLLGSLLTHAGVTIRITEVEAYAGPDDPGSHAYRGRTSRNATMYDGPAHLYCYFTYGMHVCANVVVGPAGDPSAVLLRAGEVVAGVEAARQRRAGVADRDLARGPANLCRATAIGLDADGADLVDGPVRLVPSVSAGAVSTGPRVGLRLAPDRPWRFWLTGEPSVSAYRPAARRRVVAPPDDR